MRVMIVEDQTMIRSLLESYFRAEDGYRITASIPGAKQAVEVCRTSSVDLILMDVQMPVMDGYTAARKIRESAHPQAADIPVVALTANAFAEDIAKALAAGMNDHVAKPIDYERLFGVLEKCLA